MRHDVFILSYLIVGGYDVGHHSVSERHSTSSVILGNMNAREMKVTGKFNHNHRVFAYAQIKSPIIIVYLCVILGSLEFGTTCNF